MRQLIERARHLDIQMPGDAQGDVIHPGERECPLRKIAASRSEERAVRLSDSWLRELQQPLRFAGESSGTMILVVGE